MISKYKQAIATLLFVLLCFTACNKFDVSIGDVKAELFTPTKTNYKVTDSVGGSKVSTHLSCEMGYQFITTVVNISTNVSISTTQVMELNNGGNGGRPMTCKY